MNQEPLLQLLLSVSGLASWDLVASLNRDQLVQSLSKLDTNRSSTRDLVFETLDMLEISSMNISNSQLTQLRRMVLSGLIELEVQYPLLFLLIRIKLFQDAPSVHNLNLIFETQWSQVARSLNSDQAKFVENTRRLLEGTAEEIREGYRSSEIDEDTKVLVNQFYSEVSCIVRGT
ncbi:MAG: hypothetical protein K1X79_09080 [Oligoflexia bacterium]|nr:hypothetical protein [Oligoflexia bacterium]